MTNFVRYGQQGRVVTLTLNNPDERNAIGSREACDEIAAAAERVNRDRGVSVVILTGAGEAFCSGGNVKKIRTKGGFARGANPTSTYDNYRRGVQHVTSALWELEVPMIGAVNGAAIGLGCDIACICDIRIASDSARFGASFLRIGLVPGDGGAWFLPRTVGWSRAAEMSFTGELLDAEQALACGLVSRVVPAAQLLEQAGHLAARIAAQPPQALRLTKRLLREACHARLHDVLALSAAFQALVQESEDHAEAVAAMLEKRTPIFTGD